MVRKSDLDLAIHADHSTIDNLLGALLRPDPSRDDVARLVTALSAHSAAEEEILYPEVRENAPQTAVMVSQSIDEHKHMTELLTHISGRDPANPRVRSSIEALAEIVRRHVVDEEREILPALRAVVGDERMGRLGSSYLEAEYYAPTRPHPHLPTTPPANKVDPLVGAVDRARDALTGRDEQGSKY